MPQPMLPLCCPMWAARLRVWAQANYRVGSFLLRTWDWFLFLPLSRLLPFLVVVVLLGVVVSYSPALTALDWPCALPWGLVCS